MRFLFKTIAVLVVIYVVMWIGLAAYFSVAERHKGLLESTLSGVFGREVQIDKVSTAFSGFSPAIQIHGFRVMGDTSDQPALAFDSLNAELSIFSMLMFWPQLNQFAIKEPRLEIVSLPGNRLQVAGVVLQPNRGSMINPKRFVSWLLNHRSAAWYDGEVIWRRLNGQSQIYTDMSFVYQRDGDRREISAATVTPKGPFAFKARSNGDILDAKDWDADFEVLGDNGQRLLAPEDLSLKVEQGKGRLLLKTLDMQRISDFLLITGLSETASWILDARLSGRLHDLKLDFSGSLLEFDEWSLNALASEVGFQSTETTPGMTNLSGRVEANAQGGEFAYSADSSVFSWPKWYDSNFNIQRTSGQFSWSLATLGKIHVSLEDGVFEDDVVNINNIKASCVVDLERRSVINIAEIFSLDAVSNLDFEEGKLVDNSATKKAKLARPYLEATAEYAIKSLAEIDRYLPNEPRIEKFRTWWGNAFKTGTAENGKISYLGDVSRSALKDGSAKLSSQVDYTNVRIDYGYQRDWPELNRTHGSATLENDLLTIVPAKAWIDNDELLNPQLTISSLMDRSRHLDLSGSMKTSLSTVMEFLFDGPLLQPEQRGKALPIRALAGQVDADVQVSIPLGDLNQTKVFGVARINNGEFLLPQGVPINNASAVVEFTERSAESDNIRATFLSGPAKAQLRTVREEQPPVLRVIGSGAGDISLLQPWVGEHVLSLLDGTAEWDGIIDIDGPIVDIQVNSELQGVEVLAPEPLRKSRNEKEAFSVAMQIGGENIPQQFAFTYGEHLVAKFLGDTAKANSFFDSSLVRVSVEKMPAILEVKPGINLQVEYDQIDLDAWFSNIIDLAQLETQGTDTAFLDAMRTIKVKANDPVFLGRQFGAIELSAVSVDGDYWIGSLNGDNVNGTLQAAPRETTSSYRFNLSRFHLVEDQQPSDQLEAIDLTLKPENYPKIEFNTNSLKISGKPFGQLEMAGEPSGSEWQLTKFTMVDHGIRTSATGKWVNDSANGSLTSLEIDTVIDEAGDVLDEMDFGGVLKKGHGYFKSQANWLGAPHEFDFARLNGEFDMRITDGELIKVEPGGGKLLGLLNFNAIARRLTLDFSDVFSTGLQFDRMHYSGLFADGEAIMRDAYVLTPAAFLQLEGKLDLKKELVDLEIHLAPELGGNLTLLSALANPAAGAVVFLTQQIFKDQMRASSLKSYRARGTWDDFEIEDIGNSPASDSANNNEASNAELDDVNKATQ